MIEYTTIKLDKKLIERVNKHCEKRVYTSSVGNIVYLLKKSLGDDVQ